MSNPRVATEAWLLYRGGLSLVVKESDTNVQKDKRDKLCAVKVAKSQRYLGQTELWEAPTGCGMKSCVVHILTSIYF